MRTMGWIFATFALTITFINMMYGVADENYGKAGFWLVFVLINTVSIGTLWATRD